MSPLGATSVANYNQNSGNTLFFVTQTDGWAMAVIFDFALLTGGLPAADDMEIAVATYTAIGNVGDVTPLNFCDNVGSPPVATVVDPSRFGPSRYPVELAGSVQIVESFRRGDSNADGTVATLSDALFTLSFGFSGGPQPPCVDAADFDDDGVFSALVDALGLLQFAFTGGAPPPPPGAVCGADLTNDALDCLNYAACP